MKLFNTANDFGHIPDPPDRGDCETCIHHKPFSPDGINIVYSCEKWDCEYEEDGKNGDKYLWNTSYDKGIPG